MALTRWTNRDHVHVETSCIDHRDCPDDHWEGGRPEPEHPHYVEVDCSTGLVGYTRLTDEEIGKNIAQASEAGNLRDQAAAALEARYELIRGRAEEDPVFKAIAEILGIPVE